MLTLIFAQLDKAQTQRRIRELWLNVLGELLLFDVPVVVALIVMWLSVVKK